MVYGLMAQFLCFSTGILSYLNFYTMSGRGDNNKRGSSGRGASNQSNQALGQTSNEKSNHRAPTGGKPSEAQQKTKSQSANRNRSLDREEP
jgi:hypothetical protein